VCVKCGFKAPLDCWSKLGTVERFAPEEHAKSSAALMLSLGLGPKPLPEKKTILQRVREFWLGKPKPIDPSEKYPLIKIADEVT
jgi:hypothetical protein